MSQAGFSFSGAVHGAILVWLITGSGDSGEERKQSIYDLQIRPYENRIVWYHPAERLPDVAPSAAMRNPAPPRARAIYRQTLVSGTRDDAAPAPKIWLPEAPALPKQKLPPLPNALAVAPAIPPRPVRAFAPPPRDPKTAPASLSLPDAPKPAILRPATVGMDLASAPAKAPLRSFTAPLEKKLAPVTPSLPDAPQPAGLLPVAESAALPGGPTKAPPRRFTPPAAQAGRPEVPSLQGPLYQPTPLPSTGIAEATLAIASLTPAATREIPKPDAPREAAFSAGPKLRPEGGNGASAPSVLVVPGLLARGGDQAPALMAGVAVRQANLLAGVRRPSTATSVESPSAAAPPGATRVSEAPDPHLAGRAVYRLAIQMPNVTSYSGSWIVWFAEHGSAGEPATLRPPSPLRKVDPRYVPSAMSDRVEGTVRLLAVIGKDGRVDAISLIRHLDERLDRSASEALAKWQFEPATRGGVPVEVDALFEIPFRLAPRTAR